MLEERGPVGDFVAEVVDEAGRTVVRVRGDIDTATAPRFEASIRAALADDPRLVVDLAEAPFIDSSGISALLRAYQATGQLQEGVVIRNACIAVRRTLEISGIDRYLTVEPPVAGA